MKSDKWVKRWEVIGSDDHHWIVAQDKDGNWGCSCPRWKFKREECHHIQWIKGNGGTHSEAQKPKPKPSYVLATVSKPIFKEDTNELFIPLVGVPDAMMMEATICYNLLKYGYSMGEVREMRRIPSQWSVRAITEHVRKHGEAEYPEGWYPH